LALKQVFPRVVGLLFKQIPDCFNTSPVQGVPSGFAGFLFVDFDGIPRFKISDLINPKPEQIRGPQVGVDPNFYNIVGIKRREIMAIIKA
jgi:hypothetical protein